VAVGRVLRAHVRGLEERRFNALEERIEADLRLGRHRELVSELTAFAAQYPLHESMHAHLMVALHRSGRRCDALHTFHRIRHTLTNELGLEPSPLLHRLQRSILTAEDVQAPHRSSAPVARRPWQADLGQFAVGT
jgi:DNA-binding SARP family transcriptional activator